MTEQTEPHIPVSPWMTTAEAAAYLKIKPRTLLIWVRQGQVRAYALSGTERRIWRFLRTDLDTMLAHSQCAAKERFHAAP
jgi:excisionase family DNA binding protein